MNGNIWPYPGSRWWKFDFHTHTPASMDTYWARNNISLSPKEWLLKYMVAEIDCLAITDHNSGQWIDLLKAAYEQMKKLADAGNPPSGFRELTIFPGVEISVQGGVHLLAIFDPSATTGDIDTLLGKVDYDGTKGDSNGVTRKGIAEVVQCVLDAGALPIPAHVDQDKGLLRCKPDTREPLLDPKTLSQALIVNGLLAVEWINLRKLAPIYVEEYVTSFANVLGSDCHTFQGNAVPGSRFTWVKMAQPTLEGLRLALLDGNGISVYRSDEGTFDPFRTPVEFIAAIEIESARYMGNGSPERLEFSPYYNTIIGGRGTGKSTVVHALRLALRREQDLQHLSRDAEALVRFEAFRKVPRSRNDDGALRKETEIRVEYLRNGQAHRLRWAKDDQRNAVEERDDTGQWKPSSSQSINTERFPFRIFSQGQIVAMAGEGRKALLAIIDEAAGIAPLKQVYEDTQRKFLTQGAHLRELEGKIAAFPEVKRKLDDVERKINVCEQEQHTDVLKTYAIVKEQERNVNDTLQQAKALPEKIESLADKLVLDDWPKQDFGEEDNDILTWREELDEAIARVARVLREQAEQLRQAIERHRDDARLTNWHGHVETAIANYEEVQQRLAEEDVEDPDAFSRLTKERQDLQDECKRLESLQRAYDELISAIKETRQVLLEHRQVITEKRKQFVEDTLHANEFVRIEVVPFGFDAHVIEGELRELLEVTDERFADAILQFENGKTAGGLAFEMAHAEDKLETLDTIKKRLLESSPDLGGHFRNYLQRKREKPEFANHIYTWFPEDDLRIEYKRSGQWFPIEQGSQGQRSAALLAFLLAFGDEPLVLDQPEDDLDNYLIYDLIVRQIRENKLRRQLIIVTHNSNVLVNGDAELVHVMDFRGGQCSVVESGALQEKTLREEVCHVMEGGREAFERRWKRLGREV